MKLVKKLKPEKSKDNPMPKQKVDTKNWRNNREYGDEPFMSSKKPIRKNIVALAIYPKNFKSWKNIFSLAINLKKTIIKIVIIQPKTIPKPPILTIGLACCFLESG